MGRGTKVAMAITGVLAGASMAGVALGALVVTVVAGLLVWVAVPEAPPRLDPEPAVAVVAPVEEPIVAVAEPVEPAPGVVAPAPKPPRKPVAAAPSAPTRPARPTPKPVTEPAATSGDLLADEDEWEALGFDEEPDLGMEAEETTDNEAIAEELDAILEDFEPDP